MILVDAHVHIYDCFDLETFLDSALKNFKAEAARCGQQNSSTALPAIFFVVLGVQAASVGLLGEIITFTHGRHKKEYTIEKII